MSSLNTLMLNGGVHSERDQPLPKMLKKTDLPTKTCMVCGLPFVWRRKWAKNWDDVKFCSERCRRSKTSIAS